MIRDAANLEVHATGAAPPLLRPSFWICAVFMVLASSPKGLAEEPAGLVRYEATADLMGCTFGVAAYGRDREILRRHVESAFAEARAIDGWLSNYRADSELSRLNREAAASAVRVSDELFGLLTRATEFSRATDGAFDMTVGPLVRAWGVYDGAGRLPDSDELARARNAVGYRLLELDATKKSVRFARAGVELDPGGIGKGYAVDRMAHVLRGAGVTSALINACYSSVYALGAPPDSPRGWLLEIDGPKRGDGAKVFLKDQSLSTSGSREKFFEAGGRTYSHILDPRTGQPAQGLASVSVVAPTALESEVWSTAVFVNGLEWASRSAPSNFEVYGCPTDDACRWLASR
jgi:thiamine biosynthesis lipoprotein